MLDCWIAAGSTKHSPGCFYFAQLKDLLLTFRFHVRILIEVLESISCSLIWVINESSRHYVEKPCHYVLVWKQYLFASLCFRKGTILNASPKQRVFWFADWSRLCIVFDQQVLHYICFIVKTDRCRIHVTFKKNSNVIICHAIETNLDHYMKLMWSLADFLKITM